MRIYFPLMIFCLVSGLASAQEAGLLTGLPDERQSSLLWQGVISSWFADLLNEENKDMGSPIRMFMEADWVIKSVMITLLFASIMSWMIFIGRIFLLCQARTGLRRNYRRLDLCVNLREARSVFEKHHTAIGRMVRAAVDEWTRSAHAPETRDGIKERVSGALARVEAGAVRQMSGGMGVLANVASTAPFVGLFGTVWGIMNSFVSISESHTTNLAVVAPGIAEALLATALGLVSAIPAVIFYNFLSRSIGAYRSLLADAASLIERKLSRELDDHHVAGQSGYRKSVSHNDVS